MGNITKNYNRLENLIFLDREEMRRLRSTLETLELRVSALEELKRMLEPQLDEEEQQEINELLEKSQLVGFVETDYKMPEDYSGSFDDSFRVYNRLKIILNS